MKTPWRVAKIGKKERSGVTVKIGKLHEEICGYPHFV
jgi:hypothetical protein